MKRIFLALCCFFLLSQASFGCFLLVQPITKFDPSEYIFTGEVDSLVGPFESKNFRQQAWGLRVKVTDVVHLPGPPVKYFEVIPYQLWADCGTVGTPDNELLKYYPVGTRVKVIARKAILLLGNSKVGDIRLEIAPGTLSSVSRNSYEDGRQMADAHSVFDYKAFRQVTPNDYVLPFMPFLEAKSALPDFELRKDLLRLNEAATRREKISILERLLYYPACCRGVEYNEIARHYLRDSKLARSLARRREAWITKVN